MATAPSPSPGTLLPPPRMETGLLGWVRANLFSSRFNGTLTILVGAFVAVCLWHGLRWVFTSADWSVIATVGGRFFIGNYNNDQVCPGNNCFWRPQVVLLLVTMLLGLAWGMIGSGAIKRIAILVAVASALFAFLPYGLGEMGMDVRLLLAGNLLTLGLGWSLGRYTPLGTLKGLGLWAVATFGLSILVLHGVPGIPGFPVVQVENWGGLQLNLILAVAGITLSLPIGIVLALGRRSRLPLVKVLCVTFIEVFRGVPLITLLFMSQHLVPLAFPETFPRNSLVNASVVITLFSSAYMAENIRGGLQALHPGQAEAARALGLPSWQTTIFISLPQAIRNVIPAIVGQFISLFKDTSLVYVIGMLDLLQVGSTTVVGRPEYQGNVHEMFIFVALVFWVFTFGMSYVSRRAEENLGVGQR